MNSWDLETLLGRLCGTAAVFWFSEKLGLVHGSIWTDSCQVLDILLIGIAALLPRHHGPDCFQEDERDDQ